MTTGTRFGRDGDGRKVRIEVVTKDHRTVILPMRPEDLAAWRGLRKSKFSDQSKLGHRIATDHNFVVSRLLIVLVLAPILVVLEFAIISPWWSEIVVFLQMLVGVALIPGYYICQVKKRQRLVREARDALLRKNGHVGIDGDTVWPHVGLNGWNYPTSYELEEKEAEEGE